MVSQKKAVHFIFLQNWNHLFWRN